MKSIENAAALPSGFEAMRRRSIACALIIAAAVAGYVAYASIHNKGPLIFSPIQTLGALWQSYKKTYVTGDFRTADPGRAGDTTSEGQSYTMLRAAWIGDKQTFDDSWGWTQKNLERPDYLFSWLWGKRADGSMGILTDQSGQNSASDADQDIALALLLAYGRWQDPHYLSSAQNIIASIWKNEVIEVGGKPYLAADNIEKTSHTKHIVINPSYFDFAAYRAFAQADPSHPWMTLRDDSYQLLLQSIQAPLGATASAGLPPDWLWMDRHTGALSAPAANTGSTTAQTTNFGYDALRIPWRLALDYAWSGDLRDLQALKHLSFLAAQWKSAHALSSVYSHGGSSVVSAGMPAMYGGTLGYFMLENPADATDIYQTELAALYNPDKNSWTTPLSYYDDNWAWLGLALYYQLLPDTTANIHLS